MCVCCFGYSDSITHALSKVDLKNIASSNLFMFSCFSDPVQTDAVDNPNSIQWKYYIGRCALTFQTNKQWIEP